MRLFPLLIGIAGLAFTSPAYALRAYFSQACTFSLDRVAYKTNQSYFGERFFLQDFAGENSTWTEYRASDADPQPTEDFILATVTKLSEEDGPPSTTSDGCYETTTWAHKEKVAVRYFSAEAQKRLGYSLAVGQELDLDCQARIDEQVGPDCRH